MEFLGGNHIKLDLLAELLPLVSNLLQRHGIIHSEVSSVSLYELSRIEGASRFKETFKLLLSQLGRPSEEWS